MAEFHFNVINTPCWSECDGLLERLLRCPGLWASSEYWLAESLINSVCSADAWARSRPGCVKLTENDWLGRVDG